MSRILLALSVVLAACAQEDPSTVSRPPESVTATFVALNGSDVTGTVELKQDGSKVRIQIDANGLEAAMHPSHIHGFPEGGEARCPTAAADADANGLIEVNEAESVYGPVLIPLPGSPQVGTDKIFKLDETVSIDLDEIGPLSARVIVIHGKTADPTKSGQPTYVSSLPIACAAL